MLVKRQKESFTKSEVKDQKIKPEYSYDLKKIQTPREKLKEDFLDLTNQKLKLTSDLEEVKQEINNSNLSNEEKREREVEAMKIYKDSVNDLKQKMIDLVTAGEEKIDIQSSDKEGLENDDLEKLKTQNEEKENSEKISSVKKKYHEVNDLIKDINNKKTT